VDGLLFEVSGGGHHGQEDDLFSLGGVEKKQ
jgi:hypothetical protein